ncbi:hypothetical protein BGZ79_000203, partial [Entomortierella chlamydospora]
MTATSLFPLVRVRRAAASPSSATTFAAASLSWTLEVPDAVRVNLESWTDPIEVVSYVGCNRSTQDELWLAAVKAASAAADAAFSESEHTTHKAFTEDTPLPSDMNANSFGHSGGIWAWLTTRNIETDPGLGLEPGTGAESYHTPVMHTLYLINRDDELWKDDDDDFRCFHPSHNQQQQQQQQDHQHQCRPYTLDNILAPLLAICSAKMNIVSVTTRDTKADLSHLNRTLKVLTTPQLQQSQQYTNRHDLAKLTWHWRDSTCDTTHDSSSALSNPRVYSDHGLSILEQLVAGSTNGADNEETDRNHASEHLAVIQNCFQSIECRLPPAVGAAPTPPLDSQKAIEPSHSDSKQLDSLEGRDVNRPLKLDLKNLSRAETSTVVNPLENNWFRNLLDGDDSGRSNGPVLFTKLQACLHQLNTHPPSVSVQEMQQSVNGITRDRAFHCGVQVYHRIMNQHLDRQAIPLPWQTLALFHYDAQSKALEEIEKRYFSVGFHLPKLLREFRKHCLETSIAGVATGGATDSAIPGSSPASALESLVPTGGLYLEYYSANASALQNHHLLTLDENWQVSLKSRLLGAQSASGVMASSRSLPEIKDYSDFLLAVDQVRRGYLETCIPSPEAITVLESLEEMQQAESAIFLKSISVTTPSASTPTRRSSITASTRRQSIVNSGGSGSDLLTDTLSGKRTSIQALVSASGVNIGGTAGATGSAAAAATSSAASGNGGRGGGAGGAGGAQNLRQQIEQAPADVDQQIAEIMRAKRRSKFEDHRREPSFKMYTASKWIILPAKDLVRTRKDWKVSYGDRVWLVSYWFSTRNAKMDLPEYLPRARGAPCRHVIPYGETYVICKTCPADVLCMRCFRESQKSYSRLAKGKPCQIKFKTGEKVYRCKSCATAKNEDAVLCDRCFRSHNHFGHDVLAQIAETGLTCSCCDGESWKPELTCTYHSPGITGNEYLPRPITTPPPSLSPWARLPPAEPLESDLSVDSSTDTTSVARSHSNSHSHSHSHSSPAATATGRAPHRCGHIFKDGEDIYHCRDCSFNDMVVLCSRCFHNSGCVNHRWRMGEFQSPVIESEGSKTLAKKERRRKAAKAVSKEDGDNNRGLSSSTSIGGLDVVAEDPGEDHNAVGQKRLHRLHPVEAEDGDESDDEDDGEDEDGDSPDDKELEDLTHGVSCDCGDPEMFKTAFDCTYHLPQEFRPVPNLIHCNYLFQKNETMFRCRTCYHVDTGDDDFNDDVDDADVDVDSSGESESSSGCESINDSFEHTVEGVVGSCLSDIWICGRCFVPEDHRGHDIEEIINERNEGLYCHCGDPTILRQTPSVADDVASDALAVSGASLNCRDDHNRQNVLCTTDIKEGMFYYSCK